MPQNIRPSNINKSKVPLPVYRPGQIAPTATAAVRPAKNNIIEEVTLKHEPRGIQKK